MPRIPRPPRWARRRFGKDAGELQRIIPKALAQAHDRARLAHDAAGMASLDTYGTTLHILQYPELANAISSLTGARVEQFGRHSLAIVNDIVFYPWRYADDSVTRIREARLRRPVSMRRKRLLLAHGPETMRPALDPSLEAPLDPEIIEAFPQIGEDTMLVLVPFASNVEAGLLKSYWGIGELERTARISWHHLDPLPELRGGEEYGDGARVGPQHPVGPLDDAEYGRRFDGGTMPALNFPPRPRAVESASSEIDLAPEAESNEGA